MTSFVSTKEIVPNNGITKIDGLELLRFLLAFGVVIYHYYYIGPLLGNINQELFLSYYLSPLLFCVEAFFVISGLVIALSAEKRSATEFLIARCARLAPALFVCTTITFFFTHFWPQATHVSSSGPTWSQYFASALTLPLAWPSAAVTVDYSVWSLRIELRFYLIVFLILALFPSVRLWKTIGFGLIALGTCSLALDSIRPTAMFRIAALSNYSAWFTMGIFVYLYFLYKQRTSLVVLGLACSLLLGAVQSYLEYNGVALEMLKLAPIKLTPIKWWGACLVSAGILGLIIVSLRTVHNYRLVRILSGLGAMSYPLYLIHQNLGYWLINSLSTGLDIEKVRLIQFGVILFMLLLAFFIARFVEPPMARLIKRSLASALLVRRPVFKRESIRSP